jgi:hypothetical protein
MQIPYNPLDETYSKVETRRVSYCSKIPPTLSKNIDSIAFLYSTVVYEKNNRNWRYFFVDFIEKWYHHVNVNLCV